MAQYDAAAYPLLAAAEAGDSPTVRLLLEQDADPNERTDDGWTALIMAAKGGHAAIVTALLMADAEVNPPIEGKWADPAPPETTHTALRGAAIAGQLHIVKLLVENGADANIVSAGLRTPLMGAAMNGHKATVEFLLESGASPLATNTFGETARAVAESRSHAAIAEALGEHEAAAAEAQRASSGGTDGQPRLSVGQAAQVLAAYLDETGKAG